MPRSSPSLSFTDCSLLQSINSSYLLTGHYADKNGINTKCSLNFGYVLQPNIFGTSGRANTGVSYGRFKANRHKFYCQLPSRVPLMIGRKSWIQIPLSGETLLVANKGRQPNTSKISIQDQNKLRNFFFILTLAGN
jgi:hypothetical protein